MKNRSRSRFNSERRFNDRTSKINSSKLSTNKRSRKTSEQSKSKSSINRSCWCWTGILLKMRQIWTRFARRKSTSKIPQRTLSVDCLAFSGQSTGQSSWRWFESDFITMRIWLKILSKKTGRLWPEKSTSSTGKNRRLPLVRRTTKTSSVLWKISSRTDPLTSSAETSNKPMSKVLFIMIY